MNTMKRKFLPILLPLFLLGALILQSCQKEDGPILKTPEVYFGSLISEPREVEEFHSIVLDDEIVLKVDYDDNLLTGIDLTTHNNYMENVLTYVKDGVLHVETVPTIIEGIPEVYIRVNNVLLREISLYGQSTLEFVNYKHQNRIQVNADNCLVTGFLNVDTMELRLDHDAHAIVNGTSNFVVIQGRNGSSYQGKNLQSSYADVILENGARATMETTSYIYGSVQGASQMLYLFDPLIDMDVSPDSSVDKI